MVRTTVGRRLATLTETIPQVRWEHGTVKFGSTSESDKCEPHPRLVCVRVEWMSSTLWRSIPRVCTGASSLLSVQQNKIKRHHHHLTTRTTSAGALKAFCWGLGMYFVPSYLELNVLFCVLAHSTCVLVDTRCERINAIFLYFNASVLRFMQVCCLLMRSSRLKDHGVVIIRFQKTSLYQIRRGPYNNNKRVLGAAGGIRKTRFRQSASTLRGGRQGSAWGKRVRDAWVREIFERYLFCIEARRCGSNVLSFDTSMLTLASTTFNDSLA